MSISPEQQVVVITGASSGIGRETALAFAERGASVVVAARSAASLEELVREIERLGGRGLAVPTDVAEWEQVRALADRAVERFDRIDTWVNNAMTTEYARVHDQTIEEIGRILDVGLLGQIHGMKAALPVMEARGRGVIVNIVSAEAEHGMALQAAYSAAKAGVKGFTEALRLELAHEGSGVRVCLVLPSSVNTPLFEHARSKIGVLPRPLPPVYEPKVVAETIVFLSQHPRDEVAVGAAGKLLTLLDRFAPGMTDPLLLRVGKVFEKQRTSRSDDGRDNLFEPSADGHTSTGSFGKKARASSAYTSMLELHPGRKRALLAASALAGVALLRRNHDGDG